MKCHKHVDRDAVGTCMDCHVGLCSECSKYFSMPICPSCNLKRLSSDKSEIIGSFVKYSLYGAGIALYGTYSLNKFLNTQAELGKSDPATGSIIFAISIYFYFMAPYGWAFINGLKNPNTITVHVNEGFFGLIVRKILKFFLAIMIGGFVGPYQIWKMKKRLIEVGEATKAAQSVA